MQDTITHLAKDVIHMQAAAIQQLERYVNEAFGDVVALIHQSKGRVVISGIGKSAIIAQKITATLNSTGTPALFMHAADAIHGDLGMIQEEDVVIIISKSGESPEIKALVPLIRNFGNKIIAISGHPGSYLSQQADYLLDTTVEKEACPNNLAPTTSTTAQMVMGDALAICLLHLKGFTASDFARFHPGGSLGKRMYLSVSDLMRSNDLPVVPADAPLKTVILEISGKRLGATAVLDEARKLAGIITDGDLRRMLESDRDVTTVTAEQIMTASPKSVSSQTLAVEALQILKEFNITQLPVVDEGNYVGMVHLHDIVREGII
ncbi:MAG: KpsF/GutQ family sugar-phosphate isomerase [Taibaiella sp.]|nr:KpsF/GutQ family sugar-phosphate isomerase [Taibaiella sp.]